MPIEHVLAQSVSLQDLTPTPGLTSFGALVTVIVKNAFLFAGIISFFLMVFGGYTVITSAGDAKKAEQGKAALTGAVTGLLLVIGSFFIIQLIHVVTGIEILNSSL